MNAARPGEVEGACNLTFLKPDWTKYWLSRGNQPVAVRRWSKHAFTSSDSQLINGSWITCICSARKQWDGLIHWSVSCKWGKLLQSEKSNFQPSKMRLTYIITSLQKRHPLHAAGDTAWLAGPGSPPCRAALERRNKLPVLWIVIILYLKNPLLLPSSPQPQEAPVKFVFLNLGHEFLFPNVFRDSYFYC